MPEYLVEFIKPCNAKLTLRSSNKLLLMIPRVHFKSKGDRAFLGSWLKIMEQPTFRG